MPQLCIFCYISKMKQKIRNETFEHHERLMWRLQFYTKLFCISFPGRFLTCLQQSPEFLFLLFSLSSFLLDHEFSQLNCTFLHCTIYLRLSSLLLSSFFLYHHLRDVFPTNQFFCVIWKASNQKRFKIYSFIRNKFFFFLIFIINTYFFYKFNGLP